MSEPASSPETSEVTDRSAAEFAEVDEAEIKRYGRISLACDLADRAIDLAFLSVAAFVLAVPLDASLSRIPGLSGPHSIVRLIAMFFVIYGLHLVVSIPLSFYSGFLVEHQFELSTLSAGKWLKRYTQRHLLNSVFSCVMYVGIFVLIWTTGGWWWVIAAALFFVVSVVMGQLFPVLILPRFYQTTRLEDRELQDRMAKLATGTGLSITGIYRMALSAETKKANAMLVGLGRTRRVLMGDTLLDNFSADEIEVIIAHEIGHHAHRHIPKLILMGLVYSAVGLWLCDRLLLTLTGVSDYDAVGVAALPLLMLALTLFAMALEPLTNLISRHFERQSDRYALTHTGLHDAYRTAYAKLSQQNKADPNPHPLEVALFHSHPPISERMAMANRS